MPQLGHICLYEEACCLCFMPASVIEGLPPAASVYLRAFRSAASASEVKPSAAFM
jgi:hypothetical protein